MSGIGALVWPAGRPVVHADLAAMASQMARRGPDGTAMWSHERAGLVHTSLAAGADVDAPTQPVALADRPLAITADARIDNRDELASRLGRPRATGRTSDAELILRCYGEWGDACVERLRGDFAFAIWDGEKHRLVCARDHFGVKPLYVYSDQHRMVAIASDPLALLVLPEVPYEINQGRIADFLVNELEGVDKTSTCFEGVSRVPPAHVLTWSPSGVSLRRYWTCEPGPAIRHGSDDDHAEAFLDVFTAAVDRRLRNGSTGSMLSGGIDSGSIVAIAATRAASGGSALPTFSAIAAEPEACVESIAIRAAQQIPGIDPSTVSPSSWQAIRPDLDRLTWEVAEPFDLHMTLARAVYFDARAHGTSVVLDGLDADTLLSSSGQLEAMIRRGHLIDAHRNAAGLATFWGGAVSATRLYRSALKRAVTPPSIARAYRKRRAVPFGEVVQRRVEESFIAPEFARKIGLGDRLDLLRRSTRTDLARGSRAGRAHALDHPYLTVGLERYDRVASAVSVEPCHPFLDLDVVEFCLGLPGHQLLADGWPKAILRRSMAGFLPDAVRWRRGKEHLGAAYTAALHEPSALERVVRTKRELVDGFVDVDRCLAAGDPETMLSAAGLAVWFERHEARPTNPSPC